MPDEERRVAPALDPTSYVEHVTRTAMLLEQLARDVSALRKDTEDGSRTVSDLRKTAGDTEKDLAVFKVDTGSRIAVNAESIKEIAERLRWLSRLVLGAVLTGILGGGIALIFKLAGK